jgi:transcriptional regulator with XRE-family HTH domain
MGINRVHYGYNIRRLREIMGIKQVALAKGMGNGWTQQRISKLESQEWVKPDIMERVAKALGLSPEVIENFNEEVLLNNIRERQGLLYLSHNDLSPAGRLKALMEENKALYEHLLRSEKEKNNLLRKLLAPPTNGSGHRKDP